MRILFLADLSPSPPTTGARERDYQLARALGERFAVDVVTLGPVPTARDEPFELHSAGDPPSRVRALVTSLRRPYLETRHESPTLRRFVQSGQWDIVHASHLFTARTALSTGAPVVIDAHNVETEVAKTSVSSAPGTLRRARLEWEANKTGRLERRLVPKAAAVLATSTGDAQTLAGWGGQRVTVIPNGVDCAAVAARPPAPGSSVIFVGSYDYLPNRGAAEELVDQVLPALHALVPTAELTLVGRRPPDRLTNSPPAWLHVPGEVDDVGPWLHSARVTVLPIRGGGGTRLKVLHALAAGVPVVSTPFGVAGLDLVPDCHVLLGESSQDLAHQAARVIEDDGLARSLSEEGRREVERRFDWRITTAPLAALYEALAPAR